MNWLNDLNNAMDLIEERLPGEVSLEELARAEIGRASCRERV